MSEYETQDESQAKSLAFLKNKFESLKRGNNDYSIRINELKLKKDYQQIRNLQSDKKSNISESTKKIPYFQIKMAPLTLTQSQKLPKFIRNHKRQE